VPWAARFAFHRAFFARGGAHEPRDQRRGGCRAERPPRGRPRIEGLAEAEPGDHDRPTALPIGVLPWIALVRVLALAVVAGIV